MQLWLANHIFPAFQQGLSKIISNKGFRQNYFKQRLNKFISNKGFRQNYFNVKKTESDANTTSRFVSIWNILDSNEFRQIYFSNLKESTV